MNWNWDPAGWKRSTKVWLAIATIWPIIYMGLFFVGVFSIFLLAPFHQNRSASCGNIDLLQLDRKIKNGEIKQLTVRPREILALDRAGSCEYQIFVANEATQQEILNEAREIVNGRPRVDKVEEETSRPRVGFLPVGFAALFGVHMITILLMIGLMPLYIILAVREERLDQTMRIVWIVLFCTMGLLAMPVYWYLYIWRGVTHNTNNTTPA